ncbi:MAG: hypothetical protein GVY04_23780 [Cyanobacteria bacterium]|jgi:uncharacterized protein (DUF697 family)|nr:hypothetical protein [Cyanobacteria bacterium GSL.Bin1]
MSVTDRLIGLFVSNKEAKKKTIIHGAAFDASMVGLSTAQIPGGDRIAIGGVQIDMVIQLGKLYGKRLDRTEALAIAESVLATVVGVEATNQVIKYIPGIGNISNMSVAGSITEAIGWATVNYFENPDDNLFKKIE